MKPYFRVFALIAITSAMPVTAQTIAPTPEPVPVPVPIPTPAPAPTPAPPILPEGPSPEDTAQLRAEYTALKAREAAAMGRAKPATAETLAALEAAQNQILKLEASEPLDVWKIDTLGYFEQTLRTVLVTLPTSLPLDLKLEVAVAQVAPETALYSTPNPSAGAALQSTAIETPVLRIADVGATMLIWTPEVGFSYVVSQFIEVYE